MNESVQSFQKRLAALGPDAEPVTVTPLPSGDYRVDFAESHEARMQEIARELGGFVDLSIKPGDVVERGSDSGVVAYALVVEVDDTNQQVKVEPLELGAGGMLVRMGARPQMWDIDVIKPSDKKLSESEQWPTTTNEVKITDTSDDALLAAWQDLSGFGGDDAADLSVLEDASEPTEAQSHQQEAAELRDALARQSAECDDGPDPETDEKTRGFLNTWRRFFTGEDA